MGLPPNSDSKISARFQTHTHIYTHTQTHACTQGNKDVCICTSSLHHKCENSNLAHELSCSLFSTWSESNFKRSHINRRFICMHKQEFHCGIRGSIASFYSFTEYSSGGATPIETNSCIIHKEFTDKLCLATDCKSPLPDMFENTLWTQTF